MIKANELRIGNLVKLETIILDIVEIQKDCFYANDVTGQTFKNTWADILPIPLTEDILLKCDGFKEDLDYYSHPLLVGIEFLWQGDGFKVFNCDGVCIKYIKYLHKLQNFFYENNFDEEELAVKL